MKNEIYSRLSFFPNHSRREFIRATMSMCGGFAFLNACRHSEAKNDPVNTPAVRIPAHGARQNHKKRRINMKTCAFVACLLLIASCAQSATSSPVNIDGTWSGQLAGVMGGPPMTLIYNFKVEGDTLTGSVNGAPGQWIPLEDGKIKGNKISFTVNSGSDKMKMTVKYKGKIKGDKIKLSYKTKMPGSPRSGGFAETGFYMGGQGNTTGTGMGDFGIGGFGMGGFGMDGSLDIERVK